MKLNNKRTVLIGLAFLSICAFWQMYDNIIPLILTNTFHMDETISGVIMAADNVLALFMLPLFGAISDRCTHRSGRRTPFIVLGTLVAAVALICLSFIDNAQLKHLGTAADIDDQDSLGILYADPCTECGSQRFLDYTGSRRSRGYQKICNRLFVDFISL